MEKCPSYRGVRLTIVRLIEVFLQETHLRSAWTCGSVRLREVSVLWDVRLKRFYCIYFDQIIILAGCTLSLSVFLFNKLPEEVLSLNYPNTHNTFAAGKQASSA